jgi:hypothetical protein
VIVIGVMARRIIVPASRAAMVVVGVVTCGVVGTVTTMVIICIMARGVVGTVAAVTASVIARRVVAAV